MREAITENGKVRGVACGWPEVTVYYGIPYATPPVGELRWKPPQSPTSWKGVRDCARPSGICPQPRPMGKAVKEFYPVLDEMTEDCLYLNIWTPAQSKQENLPVIFWIHGGAFVTGYGHSSHFSGEAFARQGVILVTVNYRLNIFGWLVHPELSAESENYVSGNYGLMDQIYALNWVKRNIYAFGGDPNRITLAGQSAGAMSVNCLLHSPVAKGSFQGAIMQSGGGLMAFPDMTYYRTVHEAEIVAETALRQELKVENIQQARALSSKELLERWMASGPGGSKLQCSPVIDGLILKSSLDEIAGKSAYAHVPTLLGYTTGENIPTMPTPDIFRAVMEKDLGNQAEKFFKLCPLEDKTEWEKFKFYSCSELLRSSCEAWAKLVEQQNNPLAYVYTLSRHLPGDDAGAFHGSCLTYVFKTFLHGWRPWAGQDLEISTAMNTYWANFAKYGTPNGDNGLNQKQLPLWFPYTAESEATMEFSDTLIGMTHQPENERVTFRSNALLERIQI